MGLLEWLLEPTNPGPVGTIKVNTPDPDEDGEDPPKKWFIWVAIGLGLLLVGMGLYGVFYNAGYAEAKSILMKIGGLTLYILISHYVNATPDYRNVGWLGGLMDHPFRISDDYNRWLLFIQAILLPGKLMAFSLIMSWLLCQRLYRRLRK